MKPHRIREVPIMFLGLGNVGGALLHQVLDSRDVLARRAGLRLVPIALADISGFLFDPDGLPEATMQAALATAGSGGLLDALPGIRSLDEVDTTLCPGAILADLTASPNTVPTLRAALAAGCGVVLANKLPLGAPWSDAKPLFEHPSLRYEVTVGAGLPVIAALRYLLDTGDRVTGIEGCLSGTLGYLCAQLERGANYSAAISQARTLGYTEPDPREDLSGRDVARKALILARTAGWPLENADLAVEQLYAEELASLAVEDFLGAAHGQDEAYRQRVSAAQAAGQTLRYVARVNPDGGEVGLVAVDQGSALGALRGPGNYIALHTERYDDIPLVLAGPGAGPVVTAAGVLGDAIQLASNL